MALSAMFRWKVPSRYPKVHGRDDLYTKNACDSQTLLLASWQIFLQGR